MKKKNRLITKYIIDKTNFFNKKLIYNDIYKIYLDNQYAFPFNKKKVTDTINNYIKNSIKFQKAYIFEENKDLNGNIFLKDYSYFLADTEFFNNPIICEYAIWASDDMIGHMRQ